MCWTSRFRVGIVVKELEDKFLSSVILLLIAPLMLAIAAAVKLDSKGQFFQAEALWFEQ